MTLITILRLFSSYLSRGEHLQTKICFLSGWFVCFKKPSPLWRACLCWKGVSLPKSLTEGCPSGWPRTERVNVCHQLRRELEQ